MATLNLDYKQAKGLFNDRRSVEAIENRMFFDGDHLQADKDYRGYIGERPATGDNYADFMARVKSAFVSRNAIKEFVERHNNGCLGREPIWRFVHKNVQKENLTEGQTNLIKECEDALTEAWNDKEWLMLLQTAVTTALLEEKCAIRPFILPKSRDANGKLVKQKSLSDALKMLRFEVLASDKAGVFEDEETFEDFGVYAFEDAKTKIKRAEVTYVENGITYLKTVDERDITAIANQMPTLAKYIGGDERFGSQIYSIGDLGGRLFLYEFKREALISEQVRSLQKCLNLDLTMMMRNINLAGFRQKTITNATKPTATVKTTDGGGNQVETKQEMPLRSGLLSVPFLNGLPIYGRDADKNQIIVGYTNPNINIADPVAVNTFVESLETFYEAMLTEVYQLHVAISGDATASGKSRQEARAEFEKSLMKTKTVIDALGRWLLEVALRFAADLCGRSKEFIDLRCDFNSIIDAGTPDAAERAQNISEWEKGALSLETLLARNGTEDTDVEISKIEAGKMYRLTTLDKVLDVLNKSDGKLPLEIQIQILADLTSGYFENMDSLKVGVIMAKLAKESPIIAEIYGTKEEDLGVEE